MENAVQKMSQIGVLKPQKKGAQRAPFVIIILIETQAGALPVNSMTSLSRASAAVKACSP